MGVFLGGLKEKERTEEVQEEWREGAGEGKRQEQLPPLSWVIMVIARNAHARLVHV